MVHVGLPGHWESTSMHEEPCQGAWVALVELPATMGPRSTNLAAIQNHPLQRTRIAPPFCRAIQLYTAIQQLYNAVYYTALYIIQRIHYTALYNLPLE